MASHYGETAMEILKRWPWKFFCARFARLIDYMDHERTVQDERERKQAFDRLQGNTQQAHHDRMASGLY